MYYSGCITPSGHAPSRCGVKCTSKPLDLWEDHLEELRYGPFVNEKFLFDPTLLQKIATEREAITDKRQSAAALSSIASNVYRNQPAIVAKASKRRSVAATTSTPVEASSKKAKTERVAKAMQPVQAVPSGSRPPQLRTGDNHSKEGGLIPSNPPPSGVKRWAKLSWAMAKREFTSWWHANFFSRGLAKHRGVEACTALDTSGLSVTIQKRIKSFGEPP